MGVTSIAWTDRSVNPIRARLHGHVGHHCEKISAGCANCYSSRLQSRFKMPEFRADRRQGVEVFFDDSRLREVLTRRKPTKWFWCDMTDLFGDWVEEAWIDKVFAVCALTPQHTHQILTKRPERMRAYMEARARRAMFWKDAARSLGYALEWEGIALVPFPLPNVWLGVSGEDQDTVTKRTHILLETPAAVRFLSLEPMLSEVDLHAGELLCKTWSRGGLTIGRYLDQVIVGGESGPKARPCNLNWIRQVVKQCRETETACFVKQVGAAPRMFCGQCGKTIGKVMGGWTDPCGPTHAVLIAELQAIRDSKGANPDEWPADLRVRELRS